MVESCDFLMPEEESNISVIKAMPFICFSLFLPYSWRLFLEIGVTPPRQVAGDVFTRPASWGCILCATMRKMRQWSSTDHSGNRLRRPKLWLSFGASDTGHQACQSQAHGIPVPTLWQRTYWWASFIKDFEFSSVVTSWVKLAWAVGQQGGIVLEDLQGQGHPPAPTFPTRRYLHSRDYCRK